MRLRDVEAKEAGRLTVIQRSWDESYTRRVDSNSRAELGGVPNPGSQRAVRASIAG